MQMEIKKGDEVVESIDTTVSGEYIITYTASDSKGNKNVLEITVIVKEVQNIPTPDVPETPEKPEEPDQNPETPDEPNQKPETPEKPQDKEAPVFDYEGVKNGEICESR